MAVYDDENEDKNPLSPEDLSDREGEASDPEPENSEKNSAPTEEKKKLSSLTPWAKDAAAEEKDRQETLGRLNKAKDGLGEGAEGSGFYRSSDNSFKGDKANVLDALKGTSRNKKIAIGAATGGVLSIIFAFGALFNLLGSFQLDHFFKNVEDKTGSRLMASLDSRNQSLTRAYMKIRATEIEGGTAGDNLYFKADRVKTGNPVRDWYSTMRVSKFEDTMLANQGIHFTSMVDKDGNIQLAKITRDDNKDLVNTYLQGVNGGNFNDKLNSIPQADLEKMFTVDTFDSHKAARKSVKEAVNKEIPWQRVFKRRHMRRDIANRTGIKNWRLFEKTRDKIAKEKQDIKDRLLNKIVEKYYANNPSSAQFMKCLFSNGRCSTTSDPSSPDQKAEAPTNGSDPADNNPDENTPEESAEKSAGAEIKDEIDDTIEKGVAGEAADVTEDSLAQFSLKQKLILKLTRVFSGEVAGSVNPTKWWTTATRITKVHNLLIGAAGASQLSKMIENARGSQLEGIYATYSMASDQMKSGQLSDAELSSFFDTTKNIGNSEGWTKINSASAGGTVSAAAAINPDKKTYCEPTHVPTFEEFAWMCDELKPKGSSNAQSISTEYSDTVGKIAAPIADSVNAINDSPIGSAVNWVNETFDKVLGTVIDPVINAVMENTGLGKGISTLMSTVMMRMLDFLGASPMFDGSKPGVGNLIVAGASAGMEGSARASGGIRSTPQSLAYSIELANTYQTDQAAQQSLMERYASLDNPNSMASNAMFALSSNANPTILSSKVGSYLRSVPANLGSIFTRNTSAQQKQVSATIADWAGVTKYDIPKVCTDLDPLDPDYLNKSTNVSDIGLSPEGLGFGTLRDTDKFYKAVYEKLGTDPQAEEKASKIYNCALLDARAMGNLGAVYGYKDDNGYGASTTASTTEAPTVGGGSANCQSTTGNDKIACEGDKYVGLPYGHRGVHADGGAENYRIRCPDGKIPGDASCEIDCSAFVSVMLYDAFGNAPGFPKNISLYVSTSDGSLINQTAGQGPTPLFKEIGLNEIRPGDVLSMPNHMGVVEAWDPATGKLKSIESVGGGNRLGPNHWEWNSVSEEGYNRAWRYIGPGAAL